VSASQTVFISAGEQSGDLHGAALARELTRRDPSLRLLGIGGSDMRASGVSLVADIDRMAALGIFESIRRLPGILAVRTRVRRQLIDDAVDLLVLIDYPGFNLDLARFAHRHGIAVLYYVAPQVWVWHESRSKRLRDYTDRVCVVLPFEAEFLAERGVTVEFVGHPLLDQAPVRAAHDGPNGTPADGTRGSKQILGVFPGSRRQELEYLLPTFLEAARELAAARPELEVLIARPPDLDESEYGDFEPFLLRPVTEVLGRATVALTKSGTINLQLALRGIPMIVGYRINPLTLQIVRLVTKVNRVSLINLIAGRLVVPEYLQRDFTASNLVAAVTPLLHPRSAERREMLDELEAVCAQLGTPGSAGRVATICMELLEGRA
jgi:lipid-A-disaccharide synthase